MFEHAGIKFMAPPELWMRDYNAVAVKSAVKARDKLVIIPVNGVLEKHAGFMSDTSLIDIKRNVKAATQDKSVKGILLTIDSPGGTVDGMDEVATAILEARSEKPVFSYINGMAGSLAFWIAAITDRVFSGPHSRIGSIGVYAVLIDNSVMAEKEGIKFNLISTGQFKGIGTTPGQEITDAHIEHAQGIVNTMFGFFLEAVETGRNMTREQLLPLADGKLFIGQQAVDNGLIDGIQSFEKTLAELARSVTPSSSFGARDESELLKLRLETIKLMDIG